MGRVFHYVNGLKERISESDKIGETSWRRQGLRAGGGRFSGIAPAFAVCYHPIILTPNGSCALLALPLSHRHPFRRPAWIIPLLLPLLLAAGLGILDVGLAFANGRATLIATQEQGPYRVEVSILPGRAVVNNTHLSVRVVELSSAAELTAAVVQVSATGPADAAGRAAVLGPIAAVNDVLPQFFEATLPFSVPGAWEMRISVATEAGQETFLVPLEVRAGGQINLILVAAVAVAVLALSIWTYDRIRGRRRNR